MKIVNLIGGLGNQMFQYAFALTLKERFPNENVLIDISHFHYIFLRKFRDANLHNGYELKDVFPNVSINHASCWDLCKVTWYMPNYFFSRVTRRILPVRRTEFIQNLKDSFAYNPDVYTIKGNCYYEGIWECVKYYIPYRSKIQYTFAHPEPNERNRFYINEMEHENSVGVHIRRGDYIYDPSFNNICTLDYYKRAIYEITNDGRKYTFYIFSNDIDWCKSNILSLIKDHTTIIVNGNTGKNSCWDMFLMTHCKDLIIANSSFSWWGAFLNKQNGRIIAPKTWVNRDSECDIWLDDWIRI